MAKCLASPDRSRATGSPVAEAATRRAAAAHDSPSRATPVSSRAPRWTTTGVLIASG